MKKFSLLQESEIITTDNTMPYSLTMSTKLGGSYFIKDRRYELHTEPLRDNRGIIQAYSCALWEMDGTKKVHMTCIKYAETEDGVKNRMMDVIANMIST